MYTKALTEIIIDWKESLQNLADIKVNQPFTLMKSHFYGGMNENLNIRHCLTWLNDTSAYQQQVYVLKKSFVLLEMCLLKKETDCFLKILIILCFLHENH